MLNVKGFFDYCISEKCFENNRYETTIKTLYEYGYRTIAINQTVDIDHDNEPRKKKKKGEQRELHDPVPEPHKIVAVKGCEDLTILNRLTVAFSNQDVLHKLIKSPTYKKYHIIAVAPSTTPATLFVCSSFDADILCFDPENKNNIRRNRKMYEQLSERGYHFELPYSPAIMDRTQRKNIIHTAHLYRALNKSRNIIISSSAVHSTLLRNPYDIINLALIFGLSEQQAKSSITHCGRQVYINSVGRRHGKAVMFVENLKQDTINSGQVKDTEINTDSAQNVVVIESDDDMQIDQPSVKKVKQSDTIHL